MSPREMFENLEVGFASLDRAGRFREANQYLHLLLGYEPGSLNNKSFGELVRDRSFDFPQFPKTSPFEPLKRLQNVPLTLQSSNGVLIPVIVEIFAESGRNGSLEGMYIIIKDIKVAQKFEIELADENPSFESLFRELTANPSICYFSRDLDLRFTDCNDRFAKDVGLSKEQILGKTDFDLFLNHLAVKYQADDRKVLNGGRILDTIEHHQPKGKEMTYVQVIKVPIKDAQNTVIGIHGVFWEIHDRNVVLNAWEALLKKSEARLRASEAYYHSLVENIQQMIFRKDLNGKFTWVNEQFCKLIKVRFEDIVGKSDEDLFEPEFAEKYKRDDAKVLLKGDTIHEFEVHAPKTIEEVHVEVVKTPIRDADGKIVGLQGIFWDVTQQTQRENELRRVTDLLTSAALPASIIHDVLNPLVAIAGQAQVVERDVKNNRLPSALEAIKKIQKTCQSAMSDIQLLRQFGRTGRLQPQPVNLKLIILDTEVKYSYHILDKEITCRKIIRMPKDAKALLDPLPIRIGFQNILANAIKHAQPGGKIKICVLARYKETLIWVRNSGENFKDDFLKGENNSKAGLNPCKGLGLIIAETALRLQGGSIKYCNHRRTGHATVQLSIPTSLI